MSISNKFKSITVSDERPVYEKFNITEEQYEIVKEIYDIYSESYDLHIQFINKLKLLRDKCNNNESSERLTIWYYNSREYMRLGIAMFLEISLAINRWRISKGMNYLENNYLDDIYKKRENKLPIEEVLELINVKGWWI